MAIAAMIRGDRNARGSKNRTCRSARFSVKAISSVELALPDTRSSIHLCALTMALRRMSWVSGSMFAVVAGECVMPFLRGEFLDKGMVRVDG